MADAVGLNGLSDINLSGDANLGGLTIEEIPEENKIKANLAKEKANEHFKSDFYHLFYYRPIHASPV